MTSGELDQQQQSEGISSELESFRQQWISDLRSRNAPTEPTAPITGNASRPPSSHKPHPTAKGTGHKKTQSQSHYEDDEGYHYHDIPSFGYHPGEDAHRADQGHRPPTPDEDELTAVEIYEMAAECEARRDMKNSLRLYRKAFKRDPNVDKEYRKKHHPPTAAPASKTVATSSAAPVHSRTAISDLIASFSHMSVMPPEATEEGEELLPCPISTLPAEILIHIFRDVAQADVGDFARLSMVCRLFAFVVATEQSIWRRVCESSGFGFNGMHRSWQLAQPAAEQERSERLPKTVDALEEEEEGKLKLIRTRQLVSLHYDNSWREMFRSRPRIRFNGCYITTATYNRNGESDRQYTWSDHYHLVTYYRYLRFFRDGSVISLLSASPPADVVHHLTREALSLHGGGSYGKKRDNAARKLPTAVTEGALLGRWRLGAKDTEFIEDPAGGLLVVEGEDQESEDESRLIVETEGVAPRYLYRMELDMRSFGRTKNNGLVWSGFYSYNRTSDEWDKFQLRHTKPFFFSRVKSYGQGE